MGWGHLTSSSRDDFAAAHAGISPPLRRVESRGRLKDKAYKRMDRDRGERERDRERERERERNAQVQQEQERREAHREREQSVGASGSGARDVEQEGEDGMPSTSDFVKKLYKMLKDPAFHSVVPWGPHGDCFVV